MGSGTNSSHLGGNMRALHVYFNAKRQHVGRRKPTLQVIARISLTRNRRTFLAPPSKMFSNFEPSHRPLFQRADRRQLQGTCFIDIRKIFTPQWQQLPGATHTHSTLFLLPTRLITIFERQALQQKGRACRDAATSHLSYASEI